MGFGEGFGVETFLSPPFPPALYTLHVSLEGGEGDSMTRRLFGERLFADSAAVAGSPHPRALVPAI